MDHKEVNISRFGVLLLFHNLIVSILLAAYFLYDIYKYNKSFSEYLILENEWYVLPLVFFAFIGTVLIFYSFYDQIFSKKPIFKYKNSHIILVSKYFYLFRNYHDVKSVKVYLVGFGIIRFSVLRIDCVKGHSKKSCLLPVRAFRKEELAGFLDYHEVGYV